MVIFLSICLALSWFSTGCLWLMQESSKEQLKTLKNLNSKISEELTEMRAKNSSLWSDYNEAIQKLENNLIEPETMVSWVDKRGEIETGVVLDDYQLKDKKYVVVIRMKDNKTQGAPISISFEKLIF